MASQFLWMFIIIILSALVHLTLSTKVCYVHLGCLETNNSWFSPNRPFNPPTVSREQINTTFQMYTASTKRDGESVFADYETFDSKNFFKDAERNFFIIHGFLSWAKADWILDIKDELLNIYKERANVFCVDWSGHTVDYAQTAANARVVGLEVAKFINSILIQSFNISASTVHVIGHSLGAHVGGYVGERVPNMLRITGLDPAGRHFAGMPSYVRLDPTDATFVDVIHSDTQGYGTNRPMGHIDFYANGEGEQPGCGALNLFPQFLNQGMNATLQETGTCSHSRSHQYFIESLQTFNKSIKAFCKFVAYRCENYQNIIEGKCINNCNPNTDDKCMYVGLAARPIKSQRNVIMYFKTGNFKPYCLTPYRTYISVLGTSVPLMYTVVFLTVYDSKGTATNWAFNDGQPIAVQPRMTISTLVFSTTVLSSSDLTMVNLHWNSRFYPFGLFRKALLNAFIRVKHIKVSTIDGKIMKLCPRGGDNGLDVFEYDEVMFYVDKCNKESNKSTSDNSTINANATSVANSTAI